MAKLCRTGDSFDPFMVGRRALGLVTVPGERQLAVVTGAFLVFGLFWGSWAVSTAELERATRLSNVGFGALLSVALLGAAAGNAVGGSAAERWGTARVLGAALAVWGGLNIMAGLLHSRLALAAVLILTITMGGLVDVVMNVAASSSLSATPGYLVRFHARFNVGAAAGAALAGFLLSAGHSWRIAWYVAGVGGCLVAATCGRTEMPAAEPGGAVHATEVVGVLRRERLMLIAVIFAVAAMVEGGIEIWGVLYLRTKLNSGLLVGAGGAVVAYLVAAAARTLLGVRVGRAGPVRGILIGAGTATVGIVLLATSPSAVLAAVGLVLAAGGISMCWPLFIAAAGAGRERPGPTVGAVSAAGYLGLMAGPGLVGLTSQGLGLKGGLALLAGAAALVAIGPSLRRRSAFEVSQHR
jgi:Major Facilitator Superfamily